MENFLDICLKRLEKQKIDLISSLTVIDQRANDILVGIFNDKLGETIELLKSDCIVSKKDEDQAAQDHSESMSRLMQKTAERIGDPNILDKITIEYSEICRRDIKNYREAITYLDRVGVEIIEDFFRRALGIYLDRNHRQDAIHTRRAEIKLEHSIKCFEVMKRHEIEFAREIADPLPDKEAENVIEDWIRITNEDTNNLMEVNDEWISNYRIKVLQVNKETVESVQEIELGNPASALI